MARALGLSKKKRYPYIYHCCSIDELEQRLTALALDVTKNFKPITITVRPARSRRSLEQNAFYWGVIIATVQNHLLEHYGQSYTKEDISDDFLSRFAPLRVRDTIFNRQTVQLVTTSKMTVKEKADYIDKVVAYVVGDLGIQLPADQKQALNYMESIHQ